MKVILFRSTQFLAGLLVGLALLAAGCDDFERTTYRALKVAKVEYELLQEHAARAYLDARLTQEQWDRFAVSGNRFIAAHTLTADLMKAYQQARRAGDAAAPSRENIRRQVGAVLAQLPPLLGDLEALLASFEQPAASPPPPQR